MWAILYAIKRSWTQHFVTQFSGFIIMILTYSAVLFIALSLTNIQSSFDTWGQINKVTVYLKKNQETSKLEDLNSWLKKNELVQYFRVVSPQESSEKFKNRFSKISNHKLESEQLEKFFPLLYELTLKQSMAYHEGVNVLDKFSEQLITMFEVVGSVSYGKQWLQRYTILLNYLNRGGWFLVLLFIVAAVIVSTSVIKTILYSKRDEIEIMEFVGASEYSIYLPQVINVVIVSAISFLIALAFNFFAYNFMLNHYQEVVSGELLSSFSFLSLNLIVGILLLSLGACFLYSVFTIFSLLPGRKKALIFHEVIQ